MTEGLQFDFQQGNGNLLFSVMPKLALGLTQPPMQWVPGAVLPGVKQQGHEADHSPPSSAKVKNRGAVPSLLHTSSWRGA
jgi:hypothetical protein